MRRWLRWWWRKYGLSMKIDGIVILLINIFYIISFDQSWSPCKKTTIEKTIKYWIPYQSFGNKCLPLQLSISYSYKQYLSTFWWCVYFSYQNVDTPKGTSQVPFWVKIHTQKGTSHFWVWIMPRTSGMKTYPERDCQLDVHFWKWTSRRFITTTNTTQK